MKKPNSLSSHLQLAILVMICLFMVLPNAQAQQQSYKRYGTVPNMMPVSPVADGQFGRAMTTVGDINGNGVPDLAISALRNVNGQLEAAVHIVFMASNYAMDSMYTIGADDPIVGSLFAANTTIGSSLAAIGDINNDGIPDLAIGDPQSAVGGTNTGAVHLVTLNPNGAIGTVKSINRNTPGFSGVTEIGSAFGSSICLIGDIDQDGRSELFVGAPNTSSGGTARGAGYVLFLDDSCAVLSSATLSCLSYGSAGISTMNNAHFGQAACIAGDHDRDGLPDLFISAPGADSTGVVYLFNMRSDGGIESGTALTIDQTTPFNDLVIGAEFGSALAYLNGRNGHTRLAVASSAANEGNGMIWLMEVDSVGGIVSGTLVLDSVGNNTISLPYQATDGFATAMATGPDMDGNGSKDLLIGAPHTLVNDSTFGNIWTLFTADVPVYEHIRSVVTTLTANNTATGAIDVTLHGFNATQPTLDWELGKSYGPSIRDLEKGNVLLELKRTGLPTISKVYSIGFETHWMDSLNDAKHEKSIVHDQLGHARINATATNKFPSNEDAWFEYEIGAEPTTGYIGFAQHSKPVNGPNDIRWGLYLSENGNAYMIDAGTHILIENVAVGDVFKVERINGVCTYQRDSLVLKTASISGQEKLALRSGVTGFGKALRHVRTSHPPSVSVYLDVEHLTDDVDALGSITTVLRWGVGPFLYNWSNGKKKASITGLEAGTYSVTVTDALGSVAHATASVDTKVVLDLMNEIRYDDDELFKLGNDEWGQTSGFSKNFIHPGDSGYVQLTILEPDVELAFALRDTLSNIQYGMKTLDTELLAFFEGGREEAELIYGDENNPVRLNRGDVLRIERDLSHTVSVINFLLNEEVILTYVELNSTRVLVLELQLKTADNKARDLVGRFSKETNPNPTCGTPWNYQIIKTFHEDGSIRSHTKTFLDHLGRPLQTLAKDPSNNHVLVSQTVYDNLGRPAIQTLPAPIYTSNLNCYRADFMKASNGLAYSPNSFDKPITSNSAGEVMNPMGVMQSAHSTLGWYYSNNNTTEPYVAASAYPFSRILYHHDATGTPMAVHAPGVDFMPQSGHGSKQFTFNGGDILPRFLHAPNWGSLNVHKTITIDQDGKESIAYSNDRGQLLATCSSGMVLECPLQEVHAKMETDGERRIDIHVPASQKFLDQVQGRSSVRLPIIYSSTFSQANQVIYRITDVATGKILVKDVDYTFYARGSKDRYVLFLGAYATNNSYLRISYELQLAALSTGQNPHALSHLPDQEVWYTLDYGHWSFNEYNAKGELVGVTPPEGVDCDVNFDYVEQSYVFAENDYIVLCDYDGPNRVPSTADNVITTTIFDVRQRLGLTETLNNAYTASRKLIFHTDVYGCDPLQAPIPTGGINYLEEYEPRGTGPDEPLCDYTYHDPNPPFPVLNEDVKAAFNRFHRQDYSYNINNTLRDTPFQPTSGTAKYLTTAPGTPTGGGDPGRPTLWGDCEGFPAENFVTFNIALGYYGVIGTETTLIGNGWPLIAVLERNCECNMRWSIGNNLPVGIPNAEVYENVIIKIISISASTDNWGSFHAYNEASYRDDLVRFLQLQISVAMQTEPKPTAVEHRMKTTYDYDAMSQLVKSTDPDRGVTEMVYNERGQLRFSQNAEQRVALAGKKRFSFVEYDKAGRTTRTGVYAYIQNDPTYVQWRGPFDGDPTLTNTRTEAILNGSSGFNELHCEEVSSILYDAIAPDLPLTTYPNLVQQLPPGAVSRTSNEESKTWYGYDVRGRLSWTVHLTVGLNTYHTVHYEYDVRGDVSHVVYQEEIAAQRFDHWYDFDAVGRLRKVLTGVDGIRENAALQAKYQYYLHGPLKRTELGGDLQGIDYVYTLQGWLKSMNSPDANERDPGRDGVAGTPNAAFKPDQFGMALDYFNGDYQRDGTELSANLGNNTNVAPENHTGLVRAQRWNNRALAGNNYNLGGQALFYGYKYDTFGQLMQAQLGTVSAPLGANGTGPSPAPSLTLKNDYKLSNLAYDKNGNLQALKRGGISSQILDDLSYNYAQDNDNQKINNRLGHVTDAVTTTTPSNFEFPSGQATGNYTYNGIGQLTGDALENRYFSYFANGRVKGVYSDAAKTIALATFTYDAGGNRLMKESYAANGTTATERTWYLRDAGGSIVCLRQQDLSLPVSFTEELPIASVGSYMRGSATVRYELTDQLGNTRVSFTETELGEIAIVEAHDYYPHGGLLPGRQLVGAGGSPLSYQGQEYDEEVGLTAFNLRQYDARLGRWLTTDPYGKHFSPYLAMSNNPVSFIDPDGGFDWSDDAAQIAWQDQRREERFEEMWARAMNTGNSSEYSGASSDSPMNRAVVKAEEDYRNWMRVTAPRIANKKGDNHFDTDIGQAYNDEEIIGGYGSEEGGTDGCGCPVPPCDENDILRQQINGIYDFWFGGGSSTEDKLIAVLPDKLVILAWKGISMLPINKGQISVDLSGWGARDWGEAAQEAIVFGGAVRLFPSSSYPTFESNIIRVRHYTSTKGLKLIKKSNYILPSRPPVGVHFEVGPLFGRASTGAAETGAFGSGGAFVEFNAPNIIIRHSTGVRFTGYYPTATPLQLGGLKPTYFRPWSSYFTW